MRSWSRYLPASNSRRLGDSAVSIYSMKARSLGARRRVGLLVAKGLDPKIQKALDVLRVNGNEAVQPCDRDRGMISAENGHGHGLGLRPGNCQRQSRGYP